MAKKRVFISHSSFENDEQRFFEGIRDALQDDFDVLDDSDLKPGANWRQELYAWMGLCHAAIIILSPSAKRPESVWVPRECMVLCWRKELDANMPVIPLYFPGFSEQDLQDGRFKEIGLEKLQAAKVDEGGDLTRSIAGIRGKLDGLKEVETPLEQTALKVALLLGKIDDKLLDKALEKVGLDLRTWDSSFSRTLLLTTRLAHYGLTPLEDGSSPALDVLVGICQTLPCDVRLRILNLLAPSWIDLCRVRHFRRPEPGVPRPVLVLNAEQVNTLEQYVQRACSELFATPWPVYQILPDQGENGPGDLKRQVVEILKEKWVSKKYSEESRPQTALNVLAARAQSRKPVFFCIPPRVVVPLSNLASVQSELPAVTFVYLCGNDVPPDLECRPPEALLIDPRLQLGEESMAMTNLSSARVDIGCPLKDEEE